MDQDGKDSNSCKKAKVSIIKTTEKWSVPNGILAMVLGCVLIYSCMFAIGNYIYGEYTLAISLTGVVLVFRSYY